MSRQQRNLCTVCQGLDLQCLLLAAESSMLSPSSPSNLRTVVDHASVPTFYQHQPNLSSLKLASESCDLCSAIWREYSRQRASSELTDAAIAQGLGNEQIYIGTSRWDTSISAVPNVLVHQGSSSSTAQRSRQLACFEVCADYSVSPTFWILLHVSEQN
jgi:hypothetical protein